MKKILILLLFPCFLHAQTLKNSYADGALDSAKVIFFPHGGAPYSVKADRFIFPNDTTVIERHEIDSTRIWHQINKPVITAQQKIFGVMIAQESIDYTEQAMTRAGIDIVRVPIFFSQTTQSNTIDNYLDDGYRVQVNFNYLATNVRKRPYPTDTSFIRKQATAFCEYYKNWVSRIPFVAIENEWDNGILIDTLDGYHAGTIQQYLAELSICTEVFQSYGFKVSDAGITDGALKNWAKGKLDISEYTEGIKSIPFNYLNVHAYTSDEIAALFNVITVSKAYQQEAGKDDVVSNEFGIRSANLALWKTFVAQIKSFVKYGIAYSGTTTSQAIPLTQDMLKEMQ